MNRAAKGFFTGVGGELVKEITQEHKENVEDGKNKGKGLGILVKRLVLRGLSGRLLI